jgi:hypothetical protein
MKIFLTIFALLVLNFQTPHLVRAGEEKEIDEPGASASGSIADPKIEKALRKAARRSCKTTNERKKRSF